MTFAIIETGGKQLKVEPGRYYDVDRLADDPDTKLSLDQVLLVHDGNEATVGQPLVKGATIEVTVMQHRRDRKIIVYKMQPKKKTRKKRGHRQELTRLMVDAIHLDGKALGAASTKKTKKSKASDEAVAVEAEVVAD
ncbi:50S ribosomal protein L21 [Acaryochloris sp. CCMEE 5410]|uniref:50S ribosomal protein L21 n=1 Tax=Acaryochloris sp. CCMEE 5410 TaxID=310037 RepID=UPI00024843F7|nr:50S ribosomal protein L21 [Acaryochloris sp. CCMEE 5410]KAI9135254.1 50S ribosomal protein L21 [Acaryochloris sp. CCMEE 5410]